MNRSAWIGLVVGLLIGAGGIIGIGPLTRVSDSAVATTVPATAETATTRQRPVWVDATETVVGPAVLLPRGLLTISGQDVVPGEPIRTPLDGMVILEG